MTLGNFSSIMVMPVQNLLINLSHVVRGAVSRMESSTKGSQKIHLAALGQTCPFISWVTVPSWVRKPGPSLGHAKNDVFCTIPGQP